jgi:hypothetical protein
MLTKDIIERYEQVKRVLEGLDEHARKHHWDMSIWGTKTDCGTVACAAGHCSLDPWFQERGFRGEIRGTDGALCLWDEHFQRYQTYGWKSQIDKFFGVTDHTKEMRRKIDNATWEEKERLYDQLGNHPIERAVEIFFNWQRRPVEKVIEEIDKALVELRAL